MTKRCSSKCRGLKEQDCIRPCSFVKRKYCRLSSTLRMSPSECRIVKRSYTGKKRRQNLFCGDSGECISLGKPLTFFEFNRFTYAKLPLQSSESGNLFYKEIKYERDQHQAHAVLKSSKKENLVYEHKVGQYLNKVSRYIPGFMETYGFFKYPTIAVRDQVQRDNHVDLSKELIPLSGNKLTCADLTCLLIQHIPEANTLKSMCRNHTFLTYDALYIFYPIYFALSTLRKQFTHYRLTCQNVLLFEPVKHGYIEYHYHLPGEVISFKSKYVVKMSDYSRSFFHCSDAYRKMCKNPSCSCGVRKVQKNESYDLSLLRDFKKLTQMKSLTKPLPSFVDIFEDTTTSTEEVLTSSTKIHNVSDAEKRFRLLIQQDACKNRNDTYYATCKKIGELHVYTQRKEQEFISQKNI